MQPLPRSSVIDLQHCISFDETTFDQYGFWLCFYLARARMKSNQFCTTLNPTPKVCNKKIKKIKKTMRAMNVLGDSCEVFF